MPSYFQGFDLSSFWENSDYAEEAYVSLQPNEDVVASVQAELGYKLSQSYLELMQTQNGRIPENTCFPSKKRTTWAEDHVAISGILGIGREKPYSLYGELGSRFMIDSWEYPDYGIYVCDCPSAGHDMILLDYRRCGKTGEPRSEVKAHRIT